MAHMEYGGNKCIITFLVPINFLAILNLHAPRFIFVIWCASPNPTGPSCIGNSVQQKRWFHRQD